MYKTFRNKLTRQKEAAKAMYFQNEIGKSKSISFTLKTINKILRKGNHQQSTSLPSKLNINGIIISESSNICTELNQ